MRKPKAHQACNLDVIPFSACYAKTYETPTGSKKKGRTVYEHCYIVAEVAKELIARFPETISENLFPQGYELVAGVHDVGKVSPTFQKKLFQNTDNYRPESYPMLKHINPQLESNWGGHAGMSQISLDEIKPGQYIPEIAGCHHGFNPPTEMFNAVGEAFGGKLWQKERALLVEKLKMDLCTDWPVIKSPEEAYLLAGLTSVADWIGSGEHFENPEESWQHQISASLDRAGFIQPEIKKNLTFKQIFGFRPYNVQEEMIIQTTDPGVYILEAPMGLGKTEAALYAAYQLICNEKAKGIYFALPTQLTSNKLHDRFNKFLESILEYGSPHRNPLLLHGMAWLIDGSDMGEEGKPGGSWFNSRKRGLLAPFAVGTVDQALMAAMNVKHGFVRAFGLAGKVVILDEVHTYDVYTGTILNALIKILRNLACTVIILSATLSQTRKQKLLDTDISENGYPLITAHRLGFETIETSVKISSSQKVELVALDNQFMAKEEALNRAAEGQQVLWIENSVQEAQDCFISMAARASEMDIECGLLHSRFTPEHRRDKEEYWVNQFGKKGWETRDLKGRLLIGTQVLEQSLDIDADFLVTRFCPTDMIFQRLGRLWRHDETPRCPSAKRTALLLLPEETAMKKNPKTAFGVSGFVYNPYVLHRSYETWQHRRVVDLPADIRLFIEDTYAPRAETGFMAELFNELEMGTRYRKGRNALEQLARITLSRAGKTLPATKAQTRYSEMDTLDVLITKNIAPIPEEQKTSITLLNNKKIVVPWSRYQLSRKDWKKIAAKLMNQMVQTSHKTAPLPVSKKMLTKFGLGNCLYLGKQEYDESLLRLALVDATGTLNGFQGAALNENYILQYREDLGYRSKPKE